MDGRKRKKERRGREWEENAKREEERKKINDNYYLMRMIINKRFCFRIRFFNFDIQYIDKYSIERKCIPYIPKNGKARTKSKDNVTGI